ncbi:MAG: STAS domain-containing protein [Clostridia bacterium]|nr:STAS domain-containing protein [Clostridia bacterium]
MEEVKINGVTDGALHIALSGDIDLGNAEAFYQAVSAAYKTEPADILFDCAALDFIDSTTLGTFVKILKTVKQDGHTMKLVGLQPKIKKLFLICSLDSIMDIA